MRCLQGTNAKPAIARLSNEDHPAGATVPARHGRATAFPAGRPVRHSFRAAATTVGALFWSSFP